jgi:hypothetical protein
LSEALRENPGQLKAQRCSSNANRLDVNVERAAGGCNLKIVWNVIANQLFHHFDIMTSSFFKQLQVPRPTEPEFAAVDGVDLYDAITDGNLFG